MVLANGKKGSRRAVGRRYDFRGAGTVILYFVSRQCVCVYFFTSPRLAGPLNLRHLIERTTQKYQKRALCGTAGMKTTRSPKRGCAAEHRADDPMDQDNNPTRQVSPFLLLPYEIVVEIVGHLCLRDAAAAAASGTPLADAAHEVLDKRLASALAAAGINTQGNIRKDDVAAHYVALHNAIARDDPATVAAVLRAGVVPSPDAQMPPIEFMAYWATSVIATFGVAGDGYVWGAPALDMARHVPCRVPGPDGVIPYELSDDLGASRVLAVSLPRNALPHTPLVKAIRCGSRRVVRTLLAAGARPHPSVETLLACAIDRLVYRSVLMVRRRQGSTAGRVFPAWDTPEHRDVDGPGIVDDLLAAFARTPPPLDALDVNPLTVLRGALGWASIAYRWDQVGEPSDGPLSRVTRALSSLLAAGYSPDERMSLVPQNDALYGHLVDRIARGLSTHADPTHPFDEATGMRRKVVDITERQAATATHDDIKHEPVRANKYAPTRIIPLGLSAICAAYDAIPRPDGDTES